MPRPEPKEPGPGGAVYEFGNKPDAHLNCAQCGASNPPTGRFCHNCGTPLARPEAFSAGGDPSAGAAQAPAGGGAAGLIFQPSLPPGIQGSFSPSLPQQRPSSNPPVVTTGEVIESTVQCSRCRGSNSTALSFCQFCGARLGANPQDLPTPPAAAHTTSPAAARLVVIAQDGTAGRQYPLADEQTDIGREEGSILLPSDPYVSPRHARVFRRQGRFFVRDLASVNGVYVRIRAAERLQTADLVLVGLEVLRFEVVSDAERGLGPATERGTRVFGSPALPRYARLCQRTVEGATRDLFYLGRDETVVGRESGDLVFTNDPFMSRRHAVFLRDPSTNTFLVQDLGSSNGTYLAIRGEHEMSHGDHVRIGQHLFRLDVDAVRARP